MRSHFLAACLAFSRLHNQTHGKFGEDLELVKMTQRRYYYQLRDINQLCHYRGAGLSGERAPDTQHYD